MQKTSSCYCICPYIDAPGGCGKTICFNTILEYDAMHGDDSLATASTGIAAILLKRGRTSTRYLGAKTWVPVSQCRTHTFAGSRVPMYRCQCNAVTLEQDGDTEYVSDP